MAKPVGGEDKYKYMQLKDFANAKTAKLRLPPHSENS